MKFGNDSLLAPSGTQEVFLLARYTYGPMPCDMAPCCYAVAYANFTDTVAGTVNFHYTGTTVYDSVRWNFGDTTSSTVLNPTHTFVPGTYHVCLTVYTSCATDSICKDITIHAADVTNITYETDVNIYPNPSSGEYIIHSNAGFPAGATADMYDMTGKHLGSFKLAGNSTTISVAGYAPGVYQCTITINANTVIAKQLIIK